MPDLTWTLRRRRAFAPISVALAVACHDATNPGALTTGAIRVTASTTGPDPDDDGYAVTVFGGAIPAFHLGPNESVTLDSLGNAAYSIWLRDVADNCTVAGLNPRTVVVASSRLPVAAEFTVTCVAKGTVEVSNTTVGAPLDPDGYIVRLERGSSIASTVVAPGASSNLRVTAGTYTVSLGSIAANCVVTAQPGGLTRQVTVAAGATTTTSFAVACAPSVVPQLAFVRGGRIYGVAGDGTGLVQLSDGPSDFDPAWSPHGRIAFARTEGKNEWGADLSAIYVMDTDGSNVVRLTGVGYGRQPTWSPDGRRIAYADRCGGQWCIFITASTPGSGSPVRVGFDSGVNRWPAWSPDGRSIAFTSDYRFYDTLFDLYAVRIDDGLISVLAQGPELSADGLTYYFQAAWSPDGNRLAAVVCPYAWDDCYPDSRVATMNADGSSLKEITTAGGYARPTWSPDGSQLAFGSTTCRTCSSDIYVVRPDGSDRRLLITDGHSPSWRR